MTQELGSFLWGVAFGALVVVFVVIVFVSPYQLWNCLGG